MFKNKWSHKFTGGHLFTSRKSANDRQHKASTSHGHSSTKQDFLSNIVEEGSSEDIPKTFEQEEQYLNECLRSVGGSTEDVHCSEAEEYDFDDFNSIASTASILNVNSDLNNLDRLRITSPPPTPRTKPGSTQNGMSELSINGLSVLNSNDKLTNFQKSISRVQNWDRLGRSGEAEDWKQILLRAAEAGDLITVQDAVTHLGATKDSLITARDTAGNTPLHKAAQNGKLQCLKWLVKRAPKEAVAIGNNDDMTPAAIATQYGQEECLKWLVEQTEALKELEKRNAFTLVHYAAKEGQEECLKYLLTCLSRTQDVSDISDSNRITPAHLAAHEGHMECLQTLVDYHNDVTLKDKNGFSPHDYALKAGQNSCARYLVLVEKCLGLSERVKSLSQSLAQARHENEELRNRVQFLEGQPNMYLMDRPEAVGGDQSDTSSSISADSIIYSGSFPRPFVDTRRSSSAPDGESPKGTKKEGSVYEFQVNGYLSPNLRQHRASLYDIESQSRPRLSAKTMPRRGSYPATHAERKVSSEEMKQTLSIDANQLHNSSYQKDSSDGHEPASRKSPITTPSFSTVSMTTSPVCHVTQQGNEACLLTIKGSNFPEYSTSSARSSRSQSPYKSDRSTASSVETVLVTNSSKYHPRSSKCNQNVSNYAGETGSIVRKENRLSADRIANQTSLSSESPFSSDSDVEHSYERRNSHKKIVQTSPPKEELKKIRTGRIPEPRELETKISNSANQRSRLSWHGVDKVGKIPTPQSNAHDPLENSCRSLERQARVTWGDPRVQRRFTIGSAVVMGNNRTFEQVVSYQTENLYKQTKMNDIRRPLTSQVDNEEEKPWYETEEVEL